MPRHADLIEPASAAPAAPRPAAAPVVVRLAAPTADALERRTDALAARLLAMGDAPLERLVIDGDPLADEYAASAAAGDGPDAVHRRVVVAAAAADAARALSARAPSQVLTRRQTQRGRGVALLFAGLGDHYAGMGRALYESQPAFRAALDHCAELATPHLRLDLRDVLFPAGTAAPAAPSGTAPASAPGSAATPIGAIDLRAMVRHARAGAAPADGGAAAAPLTDTRFAQPAVFAVDYAVYRLLEAWGVRATAAIGHSLGEYAAAVAARVMSLGDAMRVVCTRAALIDAQPRGAMLAVAASAAETLPLVGGDVDLAAVNGPQAIVLAGAVDAIERASAACAAAGLASRRLPASHAFHSRQLRPAAAALTACVRTARLHAPSLPIVSNLTGTWMTADQAMDPGYWARHMCEPVRFVDGLGCVLGDTDSVLLEAGPGASLGSFARQHPACDAARAPGVLSSIPLVHQDRAADAHAFQIMLGRLWLSGVDVDWPAPRGGASHVLD